VSFIVVQVRRKTHAEYVGEYRVLFSENILTKFVVRRKFHAN